MAIPRSRARGRASAKKPRGASPKSVARALRDQLHGRVALQDLLDSFGHLAAARRREAGELLAIRDHLRGLVLAMLGANRPWKRIAERLEELEFVFGGYRPSFLETADPATLAGGVREIGCGNSRLTAQMNALAYNVATMRQLDARFGHMDAFVTHAPAGEIVALLCGPRSTWKLREVGRPIAMAYLENVGVPGIEPDADVARIAGPERLGILPADASGEDAASRLARFAESAGVHPAELLDCLRLFAADQHAAVCTEEPSCDECGVRMSCRYPG